MARRPLFGPKYQSPSAQRQAQYADVLFREGVDTSPVKSPLEALARIGTAGIGGYLSGKAGEKEKEYQAALSQALQSDNPLAALQSNPELAANFAPAILQSGLEESRYKRGRDDAQLVTMTPEEVQAMGLPAGTVAQRNKLGGISVISKPEKGPATIQEYEYAKQNGYTGSFADFKKMGSASQLPSNIQEWQIFQSMTPEQQAAYINMKRANPYLNIGGAMVQPNPVAPGQVMGAIEKTLPPEQTPEVKAAQAAAAATGKAEGEAAAQSRIDLPKIEAEAEYSLKLIDDMLKDPGLSGVVGVPSIQGLLRLPGTKEAGFRARLDQLRGKQFLQAFETLKGGGQITQVEGEKAEKAIARMDAAQSEADFIAAATEFQDIIRTGRNRARAKVGAAPAAPAQAAKRYRYNPATGELE